MRWSEFGRRLADPSGILDLMDDLGEAMTTSPDVCMMGGGNPALIPEMAKVYREILSRTIDSGQIDQVLGNYDPPQGNPVLLEKLAAYLRRECGWDVTAKNIAVTQGGQTAFFLLFNSLAGQGKSGKRRILFPFCPEYIGYANQGISSDMWVSYPPRIDDLGNREFKYHIDFDRLQVSDDVAGICVSRPTNPTGNVLDDDEIERLRVLARAHDVPLIIDNAYGAPFPGILYRDITPVWDEDIILTISLSKLGLPGTRTAFVVAREEVTRVLASMSAVTSLANNNIGQAVLSGLLEDDRILGRLCSEVVRPFYLGKCGESRKWLVDALDGVCDFQLHVAEGAIFHWLCLPGLEGTTMELYHKLKNNGLLVVPGEHFFFGGEEHPHRDNCLRLTYSQAGDKVQRGIGILADTLRG